MILAYKKEVAFPMKTSNYNTSPLQDAIKLIQQKRFLEAETLLVNLSRVHKKNADVWHLLAVTQKSLNKVKSCKLSIDKVLKLNPSHAAALTNKGKLLELEGKYQQAIGCYQKVLNKNSQELNSLFNFANCLYKIGDHENSLTAVNKLITLKSDHVDGYILKAQIYSSQNKLDEAIDVLDKILSLVPNHYIALNNLAAIFKTQCHWQKAIKFYNKAKQHAPSQPVQFKILKNIATCYTLLGDFAKAIEIYQHCLAYNNEDEEAHHWLNQILWEIESPEFLSSYKTQIAIKPNPELASAMAKKLRLAKEYEQAEQILIDTLRSFPSNHNTLIELGEVQRELRKFEDSFTHLKKARAVKETQLAIEQLGVAHLALNEGKKALGLFNKLLKTNENQQGWIAYKTTALRLMNSAEYDYLCNYDEHVLVTEINTPKEFQSLEVFNEALLNTLREYHRTQTHPLDQSLVGGTQTLEKLFDYHAPIIHQLKAALHEQTNEWIAKLPRDNKHPLLRRITKEVVETDSWSVILKSQGFHKSHFHPAGWLSSPYYIKLPSAMSSANNQGCIELGKPGFAAQSPLSAEKIVRPKQGLLVQFPSYMWHGTVPFASDDERVTVAYDVIPKPPL